MRNGVRLRGAAAAVVVAAGLAGCGGAANTRTTTSTPAAASPAAASPAACRPTAVRVGYAGTEGATGHMELTLALRNVSGARCELGGYPVAQLVGADGRPLLRTVRHGHGFFPDTLLAPRALVLAPGQSARIGIAFATNDEYSGARVCRTATAARVAMAGWRDSQLVSLRRAPRIAPCGRTATVSAAHA